jgi:tetratricopeptide (TPR) repeat protein
MFRVAIVVLVALTAARARAAAPSPHVDLDAMREVARRDDSARPASARAFSHYLEARRHSRAGDVDRAAEQLRLAVTYDEQSPELRVSLAQALAEMGQLGPAEGEARHALELSATGVTASEAHVLLGQIAAARRQTERASLAFRSAIRLQTALAVAGAAPDPEPWRLLAALYVDAGDEEAAVRTLEDLATRLPADGSGFRELGRTLLERREPGRGERYLRRAVQLDGRDVEAFRLLAQAHEALRREPDARDDLLAILRVEPDDGRALLALGRMALRQGDAVAAREWFHRYVRASADRADAHVRVVFQWLETSRGQEALAAARAGIEDVGPDARLRFAEGLALQELRRWPESAEALAAVQPEAGELFASARVALAEALSRAGRHAEAERALEAPLAAKPEDVRLLVMRAEVLDRAGRSPDAIALLRRAIQVRARTPDDRDLPDLYTALAESLVRAGRPADAVGALRAALAARPRDQELLYALGAAYERAGQGEVAAAQMRALLSLNPDHVEALNFLGYAYAEQGVRLEEAEKLVRRALEIKPRSGHVLDSLGWVLFRRGDHRGAVATLEQAEALAGPDATILEHLGDAYRAASRLADAAQAYRRALGSVGDEIPPDQGKRRAALERKLHEVTERAGPP